MEARVGSGKRGSGSGANLLICPSLLGRLLSFVAPRMTFANDWKSCWGDFKGRWRTGRTKGLLMLGIFVAFVWVTVGWFDEPLLLAVQGRSGADLNSVRVVAPDQEGLVAFCKGLSRYSDFFWFNFLGAVVLIILGFWKAKPQWRRAGLAFFAAGLMAGITVQVLKALSGRPRPSTVAKTEEAQHAYDFTGPNHRSGWRSYPSGHSAAVWASCVALGLRFRKALVPLLLFGVLVAWSRVYGNYHWPTDVFSGAALGSLIGWFWGRGSVSDAE